VLALRTCFLLAAVETFTTLAAVETFTALAVVETFTALVVVETFTTFAAALRNAPSAMAMVLKKKETASVALAACYGQGTHLGRTSAGGESAKKEE
jgi:hypothetical protein